jgi:hypothetical protein
MRRLNLYFGLLLFLGFLGTGAYLMFVFKPQNLANLPARMEIRANHIYIFFIALLNMWAFAVKPKVAQKPVYTFEFLFRVFLMIAGGLAVAAFFTEHNGTLAGRKLTFYAVVSSLSATVFYLVTLYLDKKGREAAKS